MGTKAEGDQGTGPTHLASEMAQTGAQKSLFNPL